MEKVEFNNDGGKLHAEMKMDGLVIISYTLQLWSSDVSDEKIVQSESGNNKQAHDDKFWLRNKDKEDEPVSANNGRFLESICTVHAANNEHTYTIELVIYQTIDGEEQELGKDTFSDTIKPGDNGHRPNLGIELIGIE